MKVAVYGKGGIGKSTTVSNVAAALALRGLKVVQIGCDPKADSTYLLMAGRRIPTVLDLMRTGRPLSLRDVVHEGFAGVQCVEAGGPLPGTGCAGRGIITAFEQLDELHAYEAFEPDVVLYDVLGDVVCGGFSLPLRGEHSDVVYVVTSGEMMAMYAASNIAQAVERFKAREAVSQAERFLFAAHEVGGLKVLTATVPDADADRLRKMGDFLKDKEPNVVAVLAAINGEKITFLAACGKEAVQKGVKAGEIVKQVSAIAGGSGGGKPDSAMGGGKDPLMVDNALAMVDNVVSMKLGL